MGVLGVANRKASEILFGTNTGVHNYIRSRLKGAMARDKVRQENATGNRKLRQLLTDGYVAVGINESRELAQFIQYFKDNIETKGVSYSNTEIDGGKVFNLTLENIDKQYPGVERIIPDEALELLTLFYGDHYITNRVTCWRNYHVPQTALSEEVFSNRYHLDADPPGMLKLFIYLSDVTEEDGPFHVLTRQDSKRILRFRFKYRKRQTPDDIRSYDKHARRMTGRCGQVFICSTALCLHRAGVPNDGHQRDAIQFEYLPA